MPAPTLLRWRQSVVTRRPLRLRDLVPGKAAGVEGEGVAGIVQAVAVFEPGRKRGALAFVFAQISHHSLVQREISDVFLPGHAADRVVVKHDLTVGLVLEVFADDGQRKQRQPRAAFPSSSAATIVPRLLSYHSSVGSTGR